MSHEGWSTLLVVGCDYYIRNIIGTWKTKIEVARMQKWKIYKMPPEI